MLDQKFRRITPGSISAPARKVSRIAPNPAWKFTHGEISSPTELPAIAPTTISISATEIPTRIEISAAASARPIHSDEASHMFSMHGPPWGGDAAVAAWNPAQGEV